ncbi:MAG: hypothetical protein V1865_02720 [bacterium]
MEKERKNDNLYLILIIFCLISFLGAILYRFYTLNTFSILLILAISIGSMVLFKMRFKLRFAFPRIKKLVLQDWLLIFVYLCLFLSATLLLLSKATDQAIISPWQVIGWEFFALYLLATAIIIISIFKNSRVFNFLIILHYWLSFSVALLVYKLGYGFDPFIHQASVKYIDEHGAIYPKNFYYLGQYSLIIIFHKLTSISIIFLDKILIPLTAAMFLPLTALHVFGLKFKHELGRKLLLVFSLLLPFSIFILTTPQNLAYLLLIMAILLGIVAKRKIDWIILYLLALTCIIIQPIAGLPALSYVIFLTIYKHRINYKQVLYVLLFIFNVVILPTSFIWVERVQNPGAVASNLFNFDSFSITGIKYPQQESWALNFTYLFQENIKYILLALILIGLYFASTRKKYRYWPKLVYFNQSLALLIAYLFTRNLNFGYLIDYEQQNYADRVLILSLLFALPFILIALYHFILRILKQERLIQYSLLIVLISAVTVSLYLSYPRFDNYFNSRGYATSSLDIEAVNWIEQDAQQDYIVLANQQVSAAALHEYGFAKYYAWEEDGEKQQIFYYPIPTGNKMYQHYLTMADKEATKETMYKAMDLAGVDLAYFVINDYWWTFDKVIKEGKYTANSYQIIGDNQLYIFKYTNK